MKDKFQRISKEKQERILTAAIDAFAANGYGNANTNKIAKAAGISVGSLFQYFENKEELFLYIVWYCSNMLNQAFAEVVKEEDAFFTTVENIVHKIMEESKRRPAIVKLYLEIASPNKAILTDKLVEQLEQPSFTIYKELIEKGKREGILKPDLPTSTYAFLLDNLFMMLQYSFSCEYYNKRFCLYCGEDAMERGDELAAEFMQFIKGAFQNR